MRRVREGMPAEVRFITGEERTGRVVFVGRAADAETRTFLAEVEVENADGAIPAGVSAEVIVPTEEVWAHFLSPAILSLDTGGVLGVKTVGEDGRVAFHGVEIVRAQTDGVWVAGLPDAARVVTIGKGFVSDGEAVDARPEDALTAEAVGTDG
jgi:multidrug efflux system membrane fusion protein